MQLVLQMYLDIVNLNLFSTKLQNLLIAFDNITKFTNSL